MEEEVKRNHNHTNRMLDKKNHTLILMVIITALLAGLIGFYGGRYFERKVFRQNFGSRQGPGMMQGNFRRQGGGNRQRFNGSLPNGQPTIQGDNSGLPDRSNNPSPSVSPTENVVPSNTVTP